MVIRSCLGFIVPVYEYSRLDDLASTCESKNIPSIGNLYNTASPERFMVMDIFRATAYWNCPYRYYITFNNDRDNYSLLLANIQDRKYFVNTISTLGMLCDCLEFPDMENELKMTRLLVNTDAPEFVLDDFNGMKVSLSDYKNKKNVLLVFNRGFM